MGAEGLIPTTDQYGTALADIVRCTACGHMQLDPMPADEVLESAYADAASEDYVAEADGQRETARRVLTRVEAHRPVGTLLDLGCWVGFLLAEARERGWEGTGIEPSTFASQYARDTFGLDVRNENLFTADLPGESFDAVVLGDVIEHLVDPGSALDRIAGLLAPEGVLAMMLPDAGSALASRMGARWWSVIPTHVQYFTRSSIGTLLRRHGWEVLEVDHAAEGLHRALLPRAPRGLQRRGLGRARQERRDGRRRRQDVGSGLPRPHARHRAAPGRFARIRLSAFAAST